MRNAALHVHTLELWLLALLLCFYCLSGPGPMNVAGPLALAAILFAGAAARVRASPLALWTGLFWLRVSAGVYFGLGTVAHLLMNETTLTELQAFHAPEPDTIALFNAVTTASILVLLATVRFAATFWPLEASPASGEGELLPAALLFAALGYGVKLLVILPQEAGAFGDTVVPGALTSLSYCAPAGLFLLALWAVRNKPALLPLVLALGIADAALGLVRLNKSEALLPLLMLALAFLHRRTSLPRLALAALLLAGGFTLIERTVGEARDTLLASLGPETPAGLADRLDALAHASLRLDEAADGYQGALVRISYVNAAAPALAFHEAGQPGASLLFIPWVAIPRVLAPQKPVFSMGRDYTVLLGGPETSSTWIGYFAESYWNLGWLGLPLVMVPLGLAFFLSARYAVWAVSEERWLHFPAVFLGIWMGIRTDGVLAGDVAASLLLATLAGLAAWLAAPFFSSRRPSPAR